MLRLVGRVHPEGGAVQRAQRPKVKDQRVAWGKCGARHLPLAVRCRSARSGQSGCRSPSPRGPPSPSDRPPCTEPTSRWRRWWPPAARAACPPPVDQSVSSGAPPRPIGERDIEGLSDENDESIHSRKHAIVIVVQIYTYGVARVYLSVTQFLV
eukprot:1195595-Prorocentrum_minimum.AAC.2